MPLQFSYPTEWISAWNKSLKTLPPLEPLWEKVQEEKKNKPKDEAIGPDEFYSTDRPGIAKQEIKDYQKVNIKTKTVKNL
jgi:hypothetical protein